MPILTYNYNPTVSNPLWDGLYAVYKATNQVDTVNTDVIRVYNGEDVNDTSGNAQHGTNVGGVTFTAGKLNNAFTFNGSNYIQLPDNSLNFTNSFSVGFWMNLNGVGADQQAPIANFMLAGGNYYGWATFVQNSTFYFNIYDGTTTAKQITYGIGPQYYNWYYYEVEYEWGVALRIKINGDVVATLSTTTTPAYATTVGTNHTPAIGVWKREGGATTYFMKNGGKIDALTIWNRTLNSNESKAIYNNGSGYEYQYPSVISFDSANDALGVYNGTPYGGLTYSTGVDGNGFVFNGTNAAVSLPTNMFNSFIGDFSINAWVYIPSGYLGSDSIQIICNLWAPSWAINFKGFRLITNGNSIVFQLADGSSYNGNTGIYTLNYNIIFATNTWYNIVATRKSSTGSKIYLNGSLVASDTNTVNHATHTTMTPQIGRMYIPSVQDGYYAPNNSKIDELYVWDRELSSTEVTELYNSGVGTFY